MKKKIEACHELYLNLQYKICLTNAYNLRLNMLTQTDNQEDLEQHKQLGKNVLEIRPQDLVQRSAVGELERYYTERSLSVVC